MKRNEMTTLKMNILGGMDSYIRNLNDEDVLEPWLMCGVPDCASEDDLEFIATDYEEWRDVCALFGRLVSKYVKDEKDEYTVD